MAFKSSSRGFQCQKSNHPVPKQPSWAFQHSGLERCDNGHLGFRKQTINKEWAGHPHIWIATILWNVSRLSCRNVPFVPHFVQSVWICTEILGQDVPKTYPQVVPETLSRHTDHQIPLFGETKRARREWDETLRQFVTCCNILRHFAIFYDNFRRFFDLT